MNFNGMWAFVPGCRAHAPRKECSTAGYVAKCVNLLHTLSVNKPFSHIPTINNNCKQPNVLLATIAYY